MPAKNEDRHGNAPDKSDVALLLIDVINDLDFPEDDQLLRFALPMAHKIAALKQRARQHGVPVVYVNDNFGPCVPVFKIDPGTGERLGRLATATVGEGCWVDLPEPIIVRPGEGFLAVPEPAQDR